MRYSIRGALIACTLTCVAVSASAQPRFAFDDTRTVLPKNVVPSHYALSLQLDPQRERFAGRAAIDVTAREAVREIVIHARGLQAARIELRSGAQRRALRLTTDAKRSTWRLAPADGRPVAAGEHRLVIAYRGRVNRTGEGLFRADHRTQQASQGRAATMLATQLQAVNARMLFPGWDEPVFRATFAIDVTAPRGLQVLSNQPLAKREDTTSGTRWRFATTPAMPSYLVAVAVGRFDALEGESAGVPLRLFTPPGKREQARFALAATQQLLPYFSGYFGTPYALPKLDQLAVPGTRDGAMEDWGLISYVEDTLLYEPARSSPRTQRTVFSIVAHEIAHQWFGNLVSVALWDEIWLNEAFATWMENKATQRFHPEWQPQLATREWLDRTMARDATAATRAIRSGAVDEARVFDVFDNITYSKGGAVLSMLEQWIGADAFQQGLAAYMRERRLAPATAGDLWHHIGQAAGRPVASVAARWTDQPGFPLLQASAQCDGGRTLVTLAQSRFAALPSSPAQGLWPVPVRVAQGERAQTWLLDEREARFEWPGCDTDTPLVVNAGGRGFYRVRYSDAWQQRLAAGFGALPAADRVALLADSHALALAGQQPLAQHFAWLARLPTAQGEGRAPLYALASSQLRELDRALHGTAAQPRLRAAARALLAPEFARVGWDERAGEDPETQRLRGELIDALAQFGDADVKREARTRWAGALRLRGAAPLPGSLRRPVLKAVARDATAEESKALWSALRATNSQEERWLLLSALSADPNAARARQFLEVSLAGWLPPNVAVEMPSFLADEPVHAQAAYAFVVAHWSRLAQLAGSGVFGARGWLLPGAADGLSESADAQRLRDDQARLAGPTGAAPAETIAAAIEVRARVRAREGTALADALASWSPAR
jgi:aminopeptidase N